MKKILRFATKEKFKKKDYLKLSLFFGVVISFFYIRTLAGYFQGDEWYYFTQLLPYTKIWYGPVAVVYNSVVDAEKVSGGAHYTPVSFLLYYLNVLLFRFTYWPYAFLALVVHLINSVLVFVLIKQLLPKKTIVAVLGSIFFACSYIHYQAVVWVMTYIWTEVAVTFFLLCIIFLLSSLNSPKPKTVLLSSLFLLLALLTKESAAVLFILIPSIIFLKKGIYIKRIFLVTFGSVALLFFVFRFIVPRVISQGSSVKTYPLDISLSVFRMVTYPLKMITEVFIPDKLILPITEFITPFAYPSYAAEKSVRGTNYLTFVQGAGSDMIIYAFAIVILFIIGIALYQSITHKKVESRNAILIGLSIIILTALPLISISTYSPSWGFVTFIDSRHIYLASIGAAILFGMALFGLANYLSGKSRKFIYIGVPVFLCILLILWIIPNFILLQEQFTTLNTMAMQRKKIINYLELSLPPFKHSQTVLVKSDTAYYGFGLIPPFQTNFGQVLAILDYDKNHLPVGFIQSDFLTKGSLSGEGYKEFQNKGFGYFVQEKPLIQGVLDRKINPKTVYAFSWNGKENNIIEYTTTFQETLREKQKYVSTFGDWKTQKFKDYGLSFRIPPSYNARELSPEGENVVKQIEFASTTDFKTYQLLLHKKTLNKGTFEDVSYMQNSNGEEIGTDFYYRNIPLIDGEILVTKLPTKGVSMQYFMPTVLPDYIIELRIVGENSEFDKKDTIAETMISFVRYQN